MLMIYLTIVNKVLRHSHSWLTRQYLLHRQLGKMLKPVPTYSPLKRQQNTSENVVC